MGWAINIKVGRDKIRQAVGPRHVLTQSLNVKWQGHNGDNLTLQKIAYR